MTAVRASGLARDALFTTSKLRNDAHHPEVAREAFAGTLSALGTGALDLFLIHWPLPRLPTTTSTRGACSRSRCRSPAT